ncbi:MAG: hypothetical protein J7518_21315 [Nocardioidaceae bacterium]|nr:hypothetical protein [Nocardioidaceae bacterium]
MPPEPTSAGLAPAEAGEALLAARAAGDHARTADILDRAGVDLAHTEYGAEVYAAATELPLELAADRPGLAWRFEDLGRLPVGTVPVRLPRTAQEATDEFLRNGDLRLRQALLPLNTRRRLGRWEEAMEIVQQAVPLAGASVYPLYGDRSGVLPYWYLQSGITAFRAGDLGTARRFLLDAWTYRDRDEYGHTARAIANQVALLDAFTGNRTASAQWRQRGEQEERRPQLWMDWFGMALEAGTAAIHATDGLDDDAGERLQEACHPSQRHGQWAVFLWLHVRQALTHGDTPRARRYLRDALESRGPEETGTGLAGPLVPLVRSEIHLASGQANHALAELEGVADVAGLTQVHRARTLLLAERVPEALDVVAAMATDPSTSKRARTEALLVAAAGHLATGDRPVAVAALQRAVAQVVEHQVPRALATVPRAALDDLLADVPALGPLLALLDERGVGDVYPPSVQIVTVTDRERELLRDLGTDRTLAEIAESTYVSVNTVRTHLANLRRKLDARSRDEVLVKARLLGLLEGEAG